MLRHTTIFPLQSHP